MTETKEGTTSYYERKIKQATESIIEEVNKRFRDRLAELGHSFKSDKELLGKMKDRVKCESYIVQEPDNRKILCLTMRLDGEIIIQLGLTEYDFGY